MNTTEQYFVGGWIIWLPGMVLCLTGNDIYAWGNLAGCILYWGIWFHLKITRYNDVF